MCGVGLDDLMLKPPKVQRSRDFQKEKKKRQNDFLRCQSHGLLIPIGFIPQKWTLPPSPKPFLSSLLFLLFQNESPCWTYGWCIWPCGALNMLTAEKRKASGDWEELQKLNRLLNEILLSKIFHPFFFWDYWLRSKSQEISRESCSETDSCWVHLGSTCGSQWT